MHLLSTLPFSGRAQLCSLTVLKPSTTKILSSVLVLAISFSKLGCGLSQIIDQDAVQVETANSGGITGIGGLGLEVKKRLEVVGVRGFDAKPDYPDFLQDEDQWWGRCRATQNMCQPCLRDCACKTGNCSWNGVCYDRNGKGSDGCFCALDSNCQSGRCASNLVCAPKVENGGGCFEDDDCQSRYCGWEFQCRPPCHGKKEIPFMVTNVELTQEGDDHYWGYWSLNIADEMQFLKNIKYCPDAGTLNAYRIYGELISLEEFKREVEDQVTAGGIDHVLYNIHGFDVNPESSFLGAHDFNQEHSADSKYLAIPINWRNAWELMTTSYEYDRNNNAPTAGRHLAAKIDVFDSSVSTSLMAHSMGNYVTRIMAQNVANPEPVFQNLFMVAADARMDMFSTEFNPGAPTVTTGMGADEENTDTGNDLNDQVYLDLPADEIQPNGGYAITQLVANTTHVVWNRGDHALLAREAFQISCLMCPRGSMDGTRKALGKYGDEAEALTAPYFEEMVNYHDFSSIIEELGLEHNYQWYEPLVDLYKEYKSEKATIMTTDTGYSNPSTIVSNKGETRAD